MRARWFDCPNWGDALNPVLIEKISGKRPSRVEWDYILNRKVANAGFFGATVTRVRRVLDRAFNDSDIHMVVGSVLQHACEKTVVWGAGFIAESSKVRVPPRKVLAVRGPHTKRLLDSQGIKCPAVFGDPALLFPRFFLPIKQKRWKFGIIPHCTDQAEKWIGEQRLRDDTFVIDINGGIEKVVEEVCSVEVVLSSSLHGLIIADAYKIPSRWIEVSKRIHGAGFKFRDYLDSVGRCDSEPVYVSGDVRIEQIQGKATLPPREFDLRPLMEACPFSSQLV